jgi:predicted nucleic acid-binding protein
MRIFVDTSAFVAVLNANDQNHPTAKSAWIKLLESESNLVSSNYVIIETYALLQNRFGMDAIRIFQNDVLPVVDIIWVDESLHNQAVSAMLTANRRQLSLVDCTSFEAMRRYELDTVFVFDQHFLEQGFQVV